ENRHGHRHAGKVDPARQHAAPFDGLLAEHACTTDADVDERSADYLRLPSFLLPTCGLNSLDLTRERIASTAPPFHVVLLTLVVAEFLGRRHSPDGLACGGSKTRGGSSGAQDLPDDARSRGHAHLAHDQAHKLLHRVRADAHPLANLLGRQPMNEIL